MPSGGRRPGVGRKRKLAFVPTGEALRKDTRGGLPGGLSDDAARCWRIVAALLARAGRSEKADELALYLLAVAWGEWHECDATIRDEGLQVERPVGKDGATMLVPHPLLGQRSTAWKDTRTMLAEFGLTPSGRSRLAPKKDEDSGLDPLSKLLGDRGD